MQEVRLLLESVIQENLIKHLKVQIYEVIQGAIAKEIKERVQREVGTSDDLKTYHKSLFFQLIVQMPQHLRRPPNNQKESIVQNHWYGLY